MQIGRAEIIVLFRRMVVIVIMGVVLMIVPVPVPVPIFSLATCAVRSGDSPTSKAVSIPIQSIYGGKCTILLTIIH